MMQPLDSEYTVFFNGRPYHPNVVLEMIFRGELVCPFTRKLCTLADVEKPTLFAKQFFDCFPVAADLNERRKQKEAFERIFLMKRVEANDTDAILIFIHELLDRRSYDEALYWTEKLPKDYVTLYYKGKIYFTKGDFIKAHACFFACYTANHSELYSMYYMALNALKHGKYTHAMRWIHKRLHYGTNVDVMVLWARIKFCQKQFGHHSIAAMSNSSATSRTAAFVNAAAKVLRCGGTRSEGVNLMRDLAEQGMKVAVTFMEEYMETKNNKTMTEREIVALLVKQVREMGEGSHIFAGPHEPQPEVDTGLMP
jgi:hypothetical protein